jgi:hypothetical protein
MMKAIMRSAVRRSAPRSRLRSPEEVQKTLLYTASFAAFTGRARMIFRAGLALNTVGFFCERVDAFSLLGSLAKPGGWGRVRHQQRDADNQRHAAMLQ